ncbi:MAG: glycosyltransferase [Wujia sp.]
MNPNKPTGIHSSLKKGLSYFKYNGISGLWSQVRYKMSGPGLSYNGWLKDKHEEDEEELLRQRKEPLTSQPLISILVPVYMTPEFYLRAMIESVQNQTYDNWELVIVDGSRIQVEEVKEDSTAYDMVYSLETERIIRQLAQEDERIKYKLLTENQGITGSLNAALEMAGGDYIALLHHDDMLTEDALYCVASVCNEGDYDIIYSDEDKMSGDGTKFSDPALKPDFSLDLIRSYNYIGHLLVVKKSLADALDGFNREYEGVYAYDFTLRAIENSIFFVRDGQMNSKKIKHISRVLYHSRIKNRNSESSPLRKDIAREVGRKALAAHMRRMVEFSTVANDLEEPLIYRITYETPGNPFISIIIPGGGTPERMESCVYPLFENARYSNFEVIIVDSDVDNLELQRCYKKMESIRSNIRVIADAKANTLPKARNKGAARARGEYLLFLDRNTEIMEATSIGELLGICLRREVGIVGGTLYTTGNHLHSQGIVLGVNGIADYPYRGIKKGTPGYLMHNCVNCNYSAVSAGCMMIKTSLYDKLGGFSEKYATILSDIDFCLRVREEGYLVVSAAYSTWRYHNENNREINEQELAREENLFRIMWNNILTAGDPYYNINFTRQGEMFTL